jgi:hypothetical protein
MATDGKLPAGLEDEGRRILARLREQFEKALGVA